MDEGLFRPQAVKQQAAKLDGEVIIAQPLGSKILLTALLVVVIVVVVFLVTSSFHRKETVVGYLHPDMGLSKVVSPRAGNIEKVFVSNGNVVKAGDALAIINIPNYLSQGDSVLAVLGESVKQQQNFTAMRRAQLELNFKQQSQDLRRQISLAEQSVTDALSQQLLLTERKQIQQRRLNNLSTLVNSGAISNNDF